MSRPTVLITGISGFIARHCAVEMLNAGYGVRGTVRSLFGPLHVHGPDGVRFYTRLKTVTSRWPTTAREGAQFVMPTMK